MMKKMKEQRVLSSSSTKVEMEEASPFQGTEVEKNTEALEESKRPSRKRGISSNQSRCCFQFVNIGFAF